MNWKKSRIIMSLMMLLILAGIGRIVYVDATAAKDKVVLLKSTTTADMIKTTESASKPEVTAVPQRLHRKSHRLSQRLHRKSHRTLQRLCRIQHRQHRRLYRRIHRIQYQHPCLRKRAKRSMPYGFILMKCIKKPKHIRHGKTILIVHLTHARRKK